MIKLLNLTNYHKAVLDIIIKSDKPISAELIHKQVSHSSKISHIMHKLNVKKAVHDLHLFNIPICHNTHGYFYAKSKDDLKQYIEKLEKKIKKNQNELEGLKNSYTNIGEKVITYQVTLPVKKGDRTITFMRFDCDDNGDPIIPPGLEIIK